MVTNPSTSVLLAVFFFFSPSVYTHKMKQFDTRTTGLLTYLKNNMACHYLFLFYSADFQDFPPKKRN